MCERLELATCSCQPTAGPTLAEACAASIAYTPWSFVKRSWVRCVAGEMLGKVRAPPARYADGRGNEQRLLSLGQRYWRVPGLVAKRTLRDFKAQTKAPRPSAVESIEQGYSQTSSSSSWRRETTCG